MMRDSMRKLLGCILLCVLLPMQAAALEANTELYTALQRMAKAKGFASPFEQAIVYADGGTRRYQGELAVLKPGKFRWAYHKPYEQLYVSNGHGIWLYEPDLMQAQLLQDLGEVDPVVLQLLDGRVSLDDVELLRSEDDGDGYTSWHVRVQSASGQGVEVWLGVHAGMLAWIESRDVLGNRNRLRLLALDFTPPPADIFEFEAPDGVDVIGAK